SGLRRRDSLHGDASLASHAPDDDDDDVDPFTPRYGAPEQFSKKYGTTGPWTDVFALALVVVETVTANHALEGEEAGQFYVAAADLLKRPTFRAKGVTTTDEVEQVMLRALAVDPKRRYQNAGEFWDALVEAMPGLGDRTRSVKPPPSVDAHGVLAAEERAREREQRRAKLILVGLAFAGGLSALGVAFLWLGANSLPSSDAKALASSSGASAQRTPAVGDPLFALGVDAGPNHPEPPNGMVYVEAAHFRMGSDTNDANEKPAHEVTVRKAYFLDKTEVAAADYAACVHAGACTKNHLKLGDKDVTTGCNQGGDLETARHPVNCIDQDQANTYCKSVGKRLPTEAEWELAARGTDGRMYPWGNDKPTTCWMAIVGGVSGACARKGTWEVGTTVDGRSPVGAFDMAGNVWEWVADGYEAYPKSDITDPFVPATGSRGVLRGGSWDYSMGAARTTSRLALSRSVAQISTGFRCAKDL
ncbi:MAG: SUMF1/EgtB/PvdO family nonheme iron enzyme, partial [Polyangiaceae bacterium]